MLDMKTNHPHTQDAAACGALSEHLQTIGSALDQYLRFEQPDALLKAERWKTQLNRSLPEAGVGIDQLLAEMASDVIPNGAQIPYGGCTAYINTGATSAGVLATLASIVAAPQRYTLTAFNYLEELSLDWMVELFSLPVGMKGIYSSGGSVANLVGLGAARQWAYEQTGVDPAADGVSHPGVIFATEASHRTIHRAAAVLGLGRNSVVTVDSDSSGKMNIDSLATCLQSGRLEKSLPIAVVANAGVTSTGAIDPLRQIGELAKQYNIWFHVDGAYGLPGILDESIRHLYDGLDLADSVIVDPHKWLGAPIGIGATFVKDRVLLSRAFAQGESDYLEGSFTDVKAEYSMDNFGIPYYDFGVELSAPARGAVVWALIREIGADGLRQRICRQNRMARWLADKAIEHPNLELLLEPTLSICCFRFKAEGIDDLNEFNRQVYRAIVRKGLCIPSTAMVEGQFAIRPCFIGARTTQKHAEELLADVLEFGHQLYSAVTSKIDCV